MGSKSGKSGKAGENKGKNIANEQGNLQNRIQSQEAKQVNSTLAGRIGQYERDHIRDNKYGDTNLGRAMARQSYNQTASGRNPQLAGLYDSLGRSGVTTDRFGRQRNLDEYGVTPGGKRANLEGTFGRRDLEQLGRMIDSGNFRNLNEQAAANRLFGFNPTRNMGFRNSLKYNFTNPGFKRDSQRLGNLFKGIGTLSPVQNLFRGVLGMDPVQMQEINPYNIGPGFDAIDDTRFDPFSNRALEGMTENAIYDRLFNQAAEQVAPQVAPSPFMGRTEDYQYTGGTPPVSIQDQYTIDPSIYDPTKNIGLDPDQVGRDIMVNPEKGINSIAAEQITNPDSITNLMYDGMGVDMTDQEKGDALTNTLPFSGYFADMFPD